MGSGTIPQQHSPGTDGSHIGEIRSGSEGPVVAIGWTSLLGHRVGPVEQEIGTGTSFGQAIIGSAIGGGEQVCGRDFGDGSEGEGGTDQTCTHPKSHPSVI